MLKINPKGQTFVLNPSGVMNLTNVTNPSNVMNITKVKSIPYEM